LKLKKKETYPKYPFWSKDFEKVQKVGIEEETKEKEIEKEVGQAVNSFLKYLGNSEKSKQAKMEKLQVTDSFFV
jgi:hypothetical protein